MPQTTPIMTRVAMLLLLCFFPVLAFGQANPSSPSTAQVVPSARIAWEGKPKITRYRLQLARNEQFTDIVFDKVVQGREYKVTEIPSGKYFWRVAPAAGETGVYSKPVAIEVSVDGESGASIVDTKPLLSPPNETGWRTATGLVEQPVAAKLRAGQGVDVVGVNSYGMVYAIDGQKGIALWSARYRPGARKGEPVNSDGAPPFAPLIVEAKDKSTSVLVAFDSGLRALDGVTGRELWRAALPGVAIVGVVLVSGDDSSATAAVFDNSRTLSFLKSDTGQIISQTKLVGSILGSPTAITVKNERAVLLALDAGALDVRSVTGASLLAIKLDAPITSAPVVVGTSRGRLVMLGTEAGLVALDTTNLNPLWRVATLTDAPIGVLSTVDLESDGTDELVMITRRGRLVVVNVESGKIKWFAETSTDAMRAVFADVNGDGTRDVLIAGGNAFALGYSGKDGKLIWRADESTSKSVAADSKPAPRGLVVAPIGSDGSGLLVGVDAVRTGLRAVGLPAGSLK